MVALILVNWSFQSANTSSSFISYSSGIWNGK